MSLYRSFDVPCEVAVHDRRGVFGQQGNALGQRATYRQGRMNHCDGVRAIGAVNHHFGTRSHTGQQGSEVGRRFLFRYVDHRCHVVIIALPSHSLGLIETRTM